MAPVSYDLNGQPWGLLPHQIVDPNQCILLAPLMANPARRDFLSTVNTAGLPATLGINSNGTGSTGGTFRNGKQITVVYADLHAASIAMEVFHSKLPNPDPDGSIKDIRWNQ